MPKTIPNFSAMNQRLAQNNFTISSDGWSGQSINPRSTHTVNVEKQYRKTMSKNNVEKQCRKNNVEKSCPR
jgi:hypothetical protein